MPPPEKTPAHERFEQIQNTVPRSARRPLLDLPNVHGHGIGFAKRGGRRTDEVAVVVYVNEKVPEDDLAPNERIPDRIQGIKTDVIEEDVPEAEALGQRRRGLRPAGGGMTGGGENVTGGTMGTCLFEHDGEQVIVTARHTSCDAEEDCTLDTYLCPDQRWADQQRIGEVAKLGTWGDPDGNNVDAAVIRIDDPADVSSDFFAAVEMGPPDSGSILGRRYLNLGAQTGLTSGTCIAKDVSATIAHGWGSQLYNTCDRFDYATTGGDSGSAWVRLNPTIAPTRRPVGYGDQGYSEGRYGETLSGYSFGGYSEGGYGSTGRQRRGVAYLSGIHVAGSEGGGSVSMPWHVIEADFGSFTVSEQSTLGQPAPKQSVALFECAGYRALLSQRTDELYLGAIITNVGGERATESIRVVDENDVTIAGPESFDLSAFESTIHTFTLDPVRNGTTVYITANNHVDEVIIDAEVITDESIQGRYAGGIANFADYRAQHAGTAKDVQRIAVRENGTLNDLWTRTS